MGEIIITGSASSRTKLDRAIGGAQSRARVRTITVEDIVKALADVENQLGIPKTALEGTAVTATVHTYGRAKWHVTVSEVS